MLSTICSSILVFKSSTITQQRKSFPAEVMPVTNARPPQQTMSICFGPAQNYQSFGQECLILFLRAFKSHIDLSPLLALFGIPSKPELPIQRVVAFTTLLARCLTPLKWKHSSPPTHDSWVKEILHCIRLEKIMFLPPRFP